MSDTKARAANETFVGRWSRRKLTRKSESSGASIKNSTAGEGDKDPEHTAVGQAQPAIDSMLANHALPTADVGQDAALAVTDSTEFKSAEENAFSNQSTITPGASIDVATDAPALNSDSDDNDEEPLLCDEDMPDISTLTANSDVSPFFNKGVSEALRKAALRYVFSLPSYNIRDGLNDYDEDYTVFEPLGNTVTCDMKFHKERKERLEQERLEAEKLEQERLAQEASDGQQMDEHSQEEAPIEPVTEHDVVDENELEPMPTEDTNVPVDSDKPTSLPEDKQEMLLAASDEAAPNGSENNALDANTTQTIDNGKTETESA